MYVFVLFKLLPPLGVTLMSIVVTPAGTVNVYQTSYVVPQLLVGLPVVVAWYNVCPEVAPQLVTGVRMVADVQSSLPGAANKKIGVNKNKQDSRVLPGSGFIIAFLLDIIN